MDKHLHIVSLDVPLPADYGGVIDIFYKIKALSEIGIKIHLHCFTKGKAEVPELNNYCASVQYYKREKNQSVLKPQLPYIVSSRSNKALLQNLNKDDHPILLEGIHCSYFLHSNQLENRKVFLRLHNTEHIYYAHLAKHEKNILKKSYLKLESKRLKKYEKEIAEKATLLALSEIDLQFFENKFSATKVKLLPAFIAWQQIKCLPGRGNYALYHGNLSVNENEAAVLNLLKENIATAEMPLLIAGKNPSEKLIRKINEAVHSTLVTNPDEAALQKLIEEAHINILPAENATGVKLKLLNALFNGRHCVVNKAAVAGTNLANLCEVVKSPREYKALLKKLSTQNFEREAIQQRQIKLLAEYNNEKNALLLSSWIY